MAVEHLPAARLQDWSYGHSATWPAARLGTVVTPVVESDALVTVLSTL